MIGNDIVDWAQARRESNWQRNGFINKLFTPDEQRLIHEANHPEQMVWTLWGLKESVYKANVRQTRKRRFAPLKIHCQLQSLSGILIEGFAFYDFWYRIRACITDNYVSSVAVSTSIPFDLHEQVITFEQTDYLHQHKQLRQFIIQYCASTSACYTTVTIQKDCHQIPSISVGIPSGIVIQLPISLSHHGRYGAFLMR